jgi:hypothetical protein
MLPHPLAIRKRCALACVPPPDRAPARPRPRPVGELLLEVAAGRDLLDALEEYAELDPRTVARVGARDCPPLPLVRVA